MDLSQHLEKANKEAKSAGEKLKIFDGLDTYSGEDRVRLISVVLEELKERLKNTPNNKVYSKIPRLDEITDGFQPGQLIVMSGPTGNGKSQFLQSLTKSFSEQGVQSLWFSYEMPLIELARRFGDEVPNIAVPNKNIDSNLEWLKVRILEGIVKFNTRVIFIDHLHYLLDMKSLQGLNMSILIGGMMRELKKFALDTETTIFLVSHLAKTKIDENPTIADLRDSSFVAQEADMVMIIWRRRKEDKDSPSGFRYTEESFLSIDKNRWNGKLGYVKLEYDKGRFIEVIDQEFNEEFNKV